MAVANLVRYLVNFPPELHEYYKSESERIGVSMSALIVMDLQNMREQKEAIKRMGQLDGIVERFERLQQTLKSEKEGDEHKQTDEEKTKE